MKRREFVRNTILASSDFCIQSFGKQGDNKLDVTFLVAADTHFDAQPDSDTYYHVRAMNRIPDTEFWPERIDGHLTHFGGAGLKLDKPYGVVLA